MLWRRNHFSLKDDHTITILQWQVQLKEQTFQFRSSYQLQGVGLISWNKWQIDRSIIVKIWIESVASVISVAYYGGEMTCIELKRKLKRKNWLLDKNKNTS